VNIQSGFFRAWVLISALWAAGLGALALVFVPEMYQSGYWYVLELRKDTDISKIDWKRPLYDLILSPSKEKLTPIFTELGSGYSNEWDKGVKDGSLKLFQDAEGARLYLKSGLSAQDTAYIEEAFVASKWNRHAKILSYWAALIVGPPMATLALGLALLWMVMGFAPSKLIWKTGHHVWKNLFNLENTD
jgi:hypothetical protein